MKNRVFIYFTLFISSVLIFVEAEAKVRLPAILSSHMVLQQNSEVAIWGWADPNETVEVTENWNHKTVSTKANKKGKWRTLIQTPQAGGPYTVKIQGQNTLLLENVLIGEVWIASGQSNMEMPLVPVSDAYTGIKDSEQEVSQADYPQIRLFQAGNFSSKEPLEDVETGIVMYGVPEAKCVWQASSSETIPTFASTAYFFARELHTQLNVPIGIIDAAWGGTAAEAWTPASGLQKLGYEEALEQAMNAPQKADQKIPARLYNGMIHPLRSLRIRGVIWYQGESNAGRADQYKQLFSTMITSWREAFGYEFPFYFGQLAPYNYQNLNSAFLREAQLQTLALPRTGMAVMMDIGNLTDIHPKNKQEVGRRLALWALAKDYGKDIVYSGPIYRESTIEGSKVRLHFDYMGGGLATKDGKALSHFEIAGDDRVFYPASALIDGEQVIVSSDKVTSPKAVRYAFTNQAMPNLMNKEGLPASSFRTDDWEDPKKDE